MDLIREGPGKNHGISVQPIGQFDMRDITTTRVSMLLWSSSICLMLILSCSTIDVVRLSEFTSRSLYMSTFAPPPTYMKICRLGKSGILCTCLDAHVWKWRFELS
jgi:hypothetical protein